VIEFAGRAILLDIEGTTSPIRFVYDVMFPFVRRELDGYLRDHWHESSLAEARQQMAHDAGAESFAAWCGERSLEAQQQCVRDEVVRLMDADVKATGLKTLQGLIWKQGFDSGELQAEVFDDVPPALLKFNGNGLEVRIYSSGSIAAQKLFFGHTLYGNLLPQFSGHYDTTSGAKQESSSYQRIAADMNIEPADILFLSDVVAELDAARQAGFHTTLVLRPGNHPLESSEHGHPEIRSFEQVRLVG
jgi:enolase-phosphatase E1